MYLIKKIFLNKIKLNKKRERKWALKLDVCAWISVPHLLLKCPWVGNWICLQVFTWKVSIIVIPLRVLWQYDIHEKCEEDQCSFCEQTYIHIYILELDIDRYEDLKHQIEFIWYHRKGIIKCFLTRNTVKTPVLKKGRFSSYDLKHNITMI